ncbi:MAG: MFS transporter [Venatoribacter sp.]
MLGSLLGLKLAQLGNSSTSAALIMTGYYFGLIIGFRLSLRIIKRVGHIRAFAAFCGVNISATLLLSSTNLVGVWVALRLLMGLSMMGSYMVIESWINERASAEIRGKIFAIYLIISYAALGGGQLLLDFADQGIDLLILCAGLFSLCLIPVALTRSISPEPLQATKLNVKQLIKVAPHAIFGCLLAGLATGSFYALGPAFAFSQGNDSHFVGLFMAATIFGGLLLQWPLGMLSDRYKRRTILQVLGGCLTLSSLLVIVLQTHWYFVFIAAALWGGIAFTIYPVAVAYANDRIDPQERVAASGVLLMSYSLGAATGPLFASALMHLSGASGLYIFSAIVGLLLALLEAKRRGAIKVSVDEQGSYIPVPRTSAVIHELNPRIEEALEEIEENQSTAEKTT